MAQRRQADAGLSRGRRAALARLAPVAGLALAGQGGLTGCSWRATPSGPPRSVTGELLELPLARPAPTRGSRWVYRVVNDYNGAVVGEVSLDITAVVPLTLAWRRPSGSSGEARFASAWSAFTDIGFDDICHFDSPVPFLPPELAPGSSITSEHRLRVAGNSGNYRWRQRVRATATEIVETPAGRFDTLVISREVWFESPDPFRFDSERRETRWYAPAVNGWVKRTWTGSYRDQGSLDVPLRRREDWVTETLIAYGPGAS